MATTPDHTTHAFTFLNYHTPRHNASHRRAVKSHISSKYRTAVRQQAQPRYALPQRAAPESLPTKAGNEQPVSPSLKRKISSPKPKYPAEDLGVFQQSAIASTLSLVSEALRTYTFASLPGRRTPCVSAALDYYVNVLSPLQEPLQLTVKMTSPLMSWGFPLIVSHESAYHGAVALSQAYLERNSSPNSRPSAEVDFHRQRAVASLRDQINSLDGPPDNGMLITVLALASLDVVYQEDTVTNRKGVALLVALKGGLDNLGSRGLIKAYLVALDYFWMLETGEKTIFPLSKRRQHREYPPIPFDSEALALVSTLPPGFAVVARQGSLGMDVLRILSRVSNPYSAAASNSDGEDHPDIFDTCSCLHSSSSTEHGLEKNICLAVILFSFNKHNPSSNSAKITAYRGSRKELTRSLPYTRHRNMQERHCLIWIWVILLGSWNLDLDFNRHTGELSQGFFENLEEARRWEDVEVIMRQFFWHDALARRWRDSWTEALGHFQARSMSRWQSLWHHPPSGDQPQSSRQSPSNLKDPEGEQDSAATPWSSSSSTGSIPRDIEKQAQATIVLPPMLTLDTLFEEPK